MVSSYSSIKQMKNNCERIYFCSDMACFCWKSHPPLENDMPPLDDDILRLNMTCFWRNDWTIPRMMGRLEERLCNSTNAWTVDERLGE